MQPLLTFFWLLNRHISDHVYKVWKTGGNGFWGGKAWFNSQAKVNSTRTPLNHSVAIAVDDAAAEKVGGVYAIARKAIVFKVEGIDGRIDFIHLAHLFADFGALNQILPEHNRADNQPDNDEHNRHF